MVVVKAAPILTSQPEEAVCVAAVTLEPNPRWIRLFPVPFRDLQSDSRFRKYQEVRLQVRLSNIDRRPESYVPILDTIEPGKLIDTRDDWAERRRRLDGLDRPTMCDLNTLNSDGSTPDVPSLAIIETDGVPQLEITERSQDRVRRDEEKANAIAAQYGLFDNPNLKEIPLEIIPWRFRYVYNCVDYNCRGHRQTIVDWEAAMLWRKLKGQSDWQELMQKTFIDRLWAPNKKSELFVGNQQQHPQSFLVLGVFYPPISPLQLSLIA